MYLDMKLEEESLNDIGKVDWKEFQVKNENKCLNRTVEKYERDRKVDMETNKRVQIETRKNKPERVFGL